MMMLGSPKKSFRRKGERKGRGRRRWVEERLLVRALKERREVREP